MTTAALILAAGRGTRAGGGLPKQWRDVAGARVVDHAIARFRDHPGIDRVLLVLDPDDAAFAPAGIDWVAGGEDRAASVRAGLAALEGEGIDRVLVHDAARCCVPAAVIDRVLAALDGADGAAPSLPVTDALWQVDAADTIAGSRSRDGLHRAQTPQGFRFAALLAAHRAHSGPAADDVEVARAAGLSVVAVAGSEDNLKITGPEDFDRAAHILKGPPMIRVGNGYDVHRFGPGDHVMLCGVSIPHDRGLQGHSDADVGLHTITDAIYGALAEGDIGQHFPPSDPQWKGTASHVFLTHACALAEDRGYAIGNIDLTLICETPKIGPHAAAMRAEVGRITGLPVDRVSVKATTTERLGFTGREEGIAAQATIVLVPR